LTPWPAEDVSAIVLAGGRSSRFGSPKLQAEVDGIPLLEHAIRAVAAVALEIVVALPADPSVAQPVLGELPRNTVVRFVRDPGPYGGPLVGLAAALEAASGRRLIVVAGDMPRLRVAVLQAMLDRLGSPPNALDREAAQAIVLTSDAQARPLPVALAAAAARTATIETLGAGDRSLRAMLTRLIVDELDPTTWRELDPEGATLIDIDEPADLDALRAADRS
jgi:molybdopterin-guanine dinucleotide biosynthesis protein A